MIKGSQNLGFSVTGFTEDTVLDENVLTVGGVEWELIPSPGHSPDCVSFYLPAEKILVCGDTVFYMNTGRVDMPGGSGDELKATIESLSRLEIEYLLPGHMEIVNGNPAVTNNFKYIMGSIFPWL